MVSKTIPINEIPTQNYDNGDGTIHLYTYHGETFTAHIMVIDNPKRIKVATTKYLGKSGETVQQMVAIAGAVAGVNGGAFSDTDQQGTGANPLGITIHDGKVITGAHSSEKYPEIAFTNGGQMIAGDYSLAELQQKDVQEALSFGPVLVLNGQPVSVPDQGYNPRTAIGQTADGKVILIVTDGRGQYGQLGASMTDITELMLKYHAKIAADLDGGSSTTMVYNNKLVNTPVDLTGARSVGTSIVVMPQDGGE
jgi:exopolysaccharide biosynthesis protein